MLALILASTPRMETPLSTLSPEGRIQLILRAYFASHRKTSVAIESGATPTPVDASTRMMIRMAMRCERGWATANHHKLVKLRERLLKTCEQHGDDTELCTRSTYYDVSSEL